MPETPETTTETTTDADDTTPTTDTEQTTEPTDSEDRGDREAAKLRKRAQAAEAERDTLVAQLEAVQRAEVERQAVAAGIRPAALWAGGAQLPDLLAEDGTVSGDAVAGAISAARDQLGIPERPKLHVPSEGSNPPPPPPSTRDSMAAIVMGTE